MRSGVFLIKTYVMSPQKNRVIVNQDKSIQNIILLALQMTPN